ncbi:hypothetical protein ACQY0O_005789 [Thecaphora frezii]
MVRAPGTRAEIGLVVLHVLTGLVIVVASTLGLILRPQLEYRSLFVTLVSGPLGFLLVALECFPRRSGRFCRRYFSTLNTHVGRGVLCLVMAILDFDIVRQPPMHRITEKDLLHHKKVKRNHKAEKKPPLQVGALVVDRTFLLKERLLWAICGILAALGIVQIALGFFDCLPQSRSMRTPKELEDASVDVALRPVQKSCGDLEHSAPVQTPNQPTKPGLGSLIHHIKMQVSPHPHTSTSETLHDVKASIPSDPGTPAKEMPHDVKAPELLACSHKQSHEDGSEPLARPNSQPALAASPPEPQPNRSDPPATSAGESQRRYSERRSCVIQKSDNRTATFFPQPPPRSSMEGRLSTQQSPPPSSRAQTPRRDVVARQQQHRDSAPSVLSSRSRSLHIPSIGDVDLSTDSEASWQAVHGSAEAAAVAITEANPGSPHGQA